MKTKISTRFIAEAGIIAALYIVLTIVSALFGLSSGVIQVRISEALCILPLFTPAAIPGLAIGCALSNLITGCALLDIVFGTVATLIGAIIAYFIGIATRKATKTGSLILKILIPFPNVIANMVIVPWVLRFVYGAEDAIWFMTLTVGAGELIAGVVLGLPLLFVLDKHKNSIFGVKKQ